MPSILALNRKKSLIPAEVQEVHFWLLVEVSPIHSKKVIMALHDHLVIGVSRKNVCESYQVNPGYFSTSLSRLYQIDKMVAQLVPYYSCDHP